jgi:hypothetical protein
MFRYADVWESAGWLLLSSDIVTPIYMKKKLVLANQAECMDFRTQYEVIQIWLFSAGKK